MKRALRGVGPLGFQLSEGVYRAYGTFEQPNPFAGFVGMVLPIAMAVTAYYVLRIAYSRRRSQSSARSTHDALRFALYAVITLLLAAGLYLVFFARRVAGSRCGGRRR